MTEQERGSDRLGRRARRFLTPVQKYEIGCSWCVWRDHDLGGRPV
jgi:hypothetical protein